MSTTGSSKRLTMSNLMLGDSDEEEILEAPELASSSGMMIPEYTMGDVAPENLILAASEPEEDVQFEAEDEAGSLSCIDVSYKQEIRPLLDVIDKLRNLNITKEGIQLPTIVVVGDQSSGKSSVLESLAGVKLPRGQGICTRVPLVMRLKSCKDKAQASISIEHFDKKEQIEEYQITKKIESATAAIAGVGSGISYVPITLEVVRMETPDLTMVDLPGITRVPIPGQPADIYEQISEIIKHYIGPNESIILNVISADVDFSTCESIRMSKIEDERGERTLAVVTKCDRAPEGLLEKVTMNAVNIRLGYVCVRNCLNDETNEEARAKEKALFNAHPKLKKIDKSIVGIPVLATRLMQIQAKSINKSLPTIVKKIDTMLSERQAELTNLPQHLCNSREADVAFVKVLNSMKECLNKIVIEGDFKQFHDDKQMHCTARMREMFEIYYNDLRNTGSIGGKFLAKETEMLEEAKGVGLPNFLSRPVFLNLLQRLVEQITGRSLELVFKVWEYIENVILQVIDFYCHCYPQLQSESRRVVQDLARKMKEDCARNGWLGAVIALATWKLASRCSVCWSQLNIIIERRNKRRRLGQ